MSNQRRKKKKVTADLVPGGEHLYVGETQRKLLGQKNTHGVPYAPVNTVIQAMDPTSRALRFMDMQDQVRKHIATQVDQTDAQQLTTYRTLWPTLKHSVIIDLHKQGVAPDDPLVAKLALTSVRTDAKDPLARRQARYLLAAQQRGENPDLLRSPVFENYMEQSKNPLNASNAAELYQATAGGGTGSDPYAAAAGGLGKDRAAGVSASAQAARAYSVGTQGTDSRLDILPDAEPQGGGPGAIFGAVASEGIGAAASVVGKGLGLVKEGVAQPYVQTAKTLGVAGIGGGPKALARDTMIGMQVPMDVVNASLRSSFQGFIDTGKSDAEMRAKYGQDLQRLPSDDIIGQSPGLLAARNALQGKAVDLGSGYFPDMKGDTWKEAAQNARDASPYLIDGHAWTLGRDFAQSAAGLPILNKIIEPGSFGFNALSGVVDGAVTLAADPFNIAALTLTDAIKARKTFSLAEDSLQAGRKNAGLFEGVRNYFHGPTVEEWIQKPEATRFFGLLAENRSFEAALKVFNGDARLAAASLDAETIPEQISIFREVAGTAIADIPKFPRTKMTADVRFLGKRPNVSWELNDPDKAVAGVYTELLNANVDRKVSPQDLFDLGDAAAHPEWSQSSDWLGRPYKDFAAYAMAKASDSGRMQVAEKVRLAEYDSLLNHAVGEGNPIPAKLKAKFKSLLSLFPDREGELRVFDVNSEGQGSVANLYVDGEEILSDLPSSYIDVNKSVAHTSMANIREIRAKTGALAKLYNTRWEGALAGAAVGAGLGYLADPEGDGVVKGLVLGGGFGAAPLETTRAIDAFYTGVFKPFVLLRPAHIARITLGMEQARLAVGGYESFWKHPLSYIAKLTEDSKTVMGAVKEAEGDPQRLIELLHQASARLHGDVQMLDRPSYSRTLYAGHGVFQPKDPSYLKKWAEYIARQRTDPVSRKLGEFSGDTARVVDWLLTDEGRPILERIASIHPDYMELLTDPNAVRRYVEHRWNALVLPKVGGGDDPALVEALHTGKINGVPILVTKRRKTIVNPEVLDVLERRASTVGPAFVPGVKEAQRSALERNIWRHGVDLMFNALISNPEDKFVRQPLFLQALWARAAELSPLMSADDAERLAQIAEKELLSGWRGKGPFRGYAGEVVARIRAQGGKGVHPDSEARWAKKVDQIVARISDEELKGTANAASALGSGEHFDDNVKLSKEWWTQKYPEAERGTLTLKEVQDIAGTHALETVKNTIHDLHDRDQVFDIFRLIAPFGDAWAQALKKWGTAVKENPRLIHRGAQIVEGARGSGFFRKDDQGEEVFSYPDVGALADGILGGSVVDAIHSIPIAGDFLLPPKGAPMQARVAGLSLMGELYPGGGPLVSILANLVLPTTPAVDSLAEKIWPFGRPEMTGVAGTLDPSTLFEQFSASWMKRLLTYTNSSGHQRDHANTVMQMIRVKLGSGEYDNFTAEGQQKLLADARQDADYLMGFRALAATSAPSSPSADYQIKDADGRFQSAVVAAQDLAKWEDEDFDTSAEKFIAKWGMNAYAAMEPLSQAITSGLPRTEKQVAWERDHEDYITKYPFVYGFFSPHDPKGKRSLVAYDRQLENKQRVPVVDDKTYLRLAMNQIGSYLYRVAQESGIEGKALQDYKKDLRHDYAGFDSFAGSTERASSKDKIEELQRAVDDSATNPDLAANPQVIAAAIYLQARKDAAKRYRALGGQSDEGWQTAKKGVGIRRDLAKKQEALKKKYPGSERMFSFLFTYDVRQIDAVASYGSSSNPMGG